MVYYILINKNTIKEVTFSFSSYTFYEEAKNTMNNIKIRDIEVYHGSKVIDNSYYIEHFKKLGKDIKHFLEDITGREKRDLLLIHVLLFNYLIFINFLLLSL